MADIFKPFNRLYTYYEQEGAVETLCRATHRLRLISVHHSFNVFFQELDSLSGTRRETLMSGHLSFQELSREDVGRLKYAEGLQYQSNIPLLHSLQRQFALGLRYFAAMDRGTVIALTGVHLSRAYLGYVNLPVVELPSGVSYLNGALTAPAFRRRGIGTALRQYIFQVLEQGGWKAVMLASHVDNSQANHWHEESGMARWGRVTYVRWRNRDLCWIRRTAVGRRYPELLNRVRHLNGERES